MKLMLCVLLVVGVSTFVFADVEEVKAKVTEKIVGANGASDKSSDSKPKRDASLLGSYHGPSYKYLPPSSGASSYDSYSHGHHGLASVGVGHSSGFGGGYSSSGIGHSSGFGGGYGGHSSSGGAYSGHSVGHHSSGHHGISSSGLGYASSGHHAGGHHGVGSSGLGYASSSGHHGASSSGLGYGSSGHHGIGSSGYSGHGIKGGSHGFSSGPSYSSILGHGGYSGGSAHSAGPSYASGHGYATSGSGSSGIGYKTHSVSVPSYALSSGHIGSSTGSTTGYQYSKGIGGSIPSVSAGFGASGFDSSHSIASASEVHHSDHSDHVHNGDQKHHYIVSGGHSAGFGGSQGGYNYESPSASYLPPVQQHVLPASSYGVPIATVGESYNTNYHSQSGSVQEKGPLYAAGHKGLGHFGYTANKPQVLHTSISSSSYKQPSYAKAPFKPSTFLGSKYEGSAYNVAPSQQYLTPSGEGADSSGYDYAIPSGTSVAYQEPNYQTNVELQSTPIHEPESTYSPPNNNEVSYNEISADPSASYLPPQQSYGVPYSH